MYRIVPDPQTYDQVAALPEPALGDYLEVLTTLQVAPWNGRPQHKDNPEGAVRHWIFAGSGQVIYLIDESRREVHVLLVQWLG